MKSQFARLRQARQNALIIRVYIMRIIFLLSLAGASFSGLAVAVPSVKAMVLNPTYGVGSWIWAEQNHPNQTCRLWRAFEIPKATKIISAQLQVTADDSYRIFLDGKELGIGQDWRVLNNYNVASYLTPGRHVLAVEGHSVTSLGGVLLGFRVEFANHRMLEIGSDSRWRTAPNTDANWLRQKQAPVSWPTARVVAPFEHYPWQKKPVVSGIGPWIWGATVQNQQTCRFWKRFRIPRMRKIRQATLMITADNSYRVFLDGQELGRGAEWRDLSEYNISRRLKSGWHTLAVQAFNDSAEAGMVLGLSVEFEDGTVLNVISDTSWRIASNNDKLWASRRRAPPDWEFARLVNHPWSWGDRSGTAPVIVKTLPIPAIIVRFWQTGWFQLTLISICLLAILACLYLLSRLAFQSQTQQVLRCERARIARDIHDDLTSRLTELVLLGEVSQRQTKVDSVSRERFSEICQNARDLSESLNEIIWLVNSQRDTLKDFVSYTCTYVERYLRSTPIRLRLDVNEEIASVPCGLAVRRNLYLAIKEALANIVRHSQATELYLQIHCEAQQVRVILEDNGCGFDPALVDSQRHGLTNMSWRAADSGGSCRVISHPGAGCRVEFSAPLMSLSQSRIRWRQIWQICQWWGRSPRDFPPRFVSKPHATERVEL